MKNVLITGISGQDGIFLVKELLESQPELNILGITRSKPNQEFYRKLRTIYKGSIENIKLEKTNLLDINAVENIFKIYKPQKIFNLAGPSSVYNSILNPKKTYYEITKIFNNLTETMIKEECFYPFFQASSSEMFSNANNQNLDEKSNFGPRSPYSEAKLENHQKTIEYWKTYNWKIYSGIMFNHESEFRGEDYLFMKIINSARLIKLKKLKKFTVGSLDYQRDWLFAGDVVKAITKIMNNGKDYNYVIGSGEANSIHDLIEIVFEYFDLKWEKYINVDPSLLRKNDPKIICSNPKKLMSELNWKNEYSFEKLVHRCITKNYSNLD